MSCHTSIYNVLQVPTAGMFCRWQRAAKDFFQSRRLVRRCNFLSVYLWQKGTVNTIVRMFLYVVRFEKLVTKANRPVSFRKLV